MAYTKNPHLPRVRRDAADFVRRGWGVRKVARYVGVSPGTVTKWVKKAKELGFHDIPTQSSRPKHHPKQLSDALVWKIFHKRLLLKRSAEVIQAALVREGVMVSLSSVKRTLDRMGLLKKRSVWKRYRVPIIRPEVKQQGDLVEIDTVHLSSGTGHRVYVFTLLDVYSRWAYAHASVRASAQTALAFLRVAQKKAPFRFRMVQSDNGSEFSGRFTEHVNAVHRHTRVRRPNDNAHLERFNRTVQEECLDKTPKDIDSLNAALKKYLPYYNNERLHLGLNLQTPKEVLSA